MLLINTDSEGIYNEALQQAVEYYGKTYPKDLAKKLAGSVQIDVAKKTVEEVGIDVSAEEFSDMFGKYSMEKLANVALMPGAERFIRHLHNNNIPIAIATSSNQESFKVKSEKHKELFELFHHIVCGGTDPEVKAGKPAPDIFLVCATRFDEKPEPSKCLVFEDSVNGVKAGLAANMQVVMIPEDHVPYDFWRTATLRIDSFEYMVPELFGLPPFPAKQDEEIKQ